jgi:hypothetical protein
VSDPPHLIASALGLTTNPFTGEPEQLTGDSDPRDAAELNAVALWLVTALNSPDFRPDGVRKLLGLTGDDAFLKTTGDILAAALQSPSAAVATLNSSHKRESLPSWPR